MEVFGRIWQWVVHLGAWQVPAVLVLLVAGGACMAAARRLTRPSYDSYGSGGSRVVKVAGAGALWLLGGVLCVGSLVCLAAVFAPLVHL
ncbi:hypothetical protein AALA48_07590 [Bifidobacterium pseudolongum]|uniref:hypothetical protein n=1 Tax=Bifidobacterium pseudolongum TaxID=1694 RepID=UPI00351401F4